jgi:hypothetical protein
MVGTQRVTTPRVATGMIFRLLSSDATQAIAGRQESRTCGALPADEDFFFVAQ